MKRLFSVLILSLSMVFAHPVFAKGFGGARVSSFSSRPAMTYRAPAVAPRPVAAPAPKAATPATSPASSTSAATTSTTSATSSGSGWLAWLPAWLLLTSSSSNASDCNKDKKDCK